MLSASRVVLLKYVKQEYIRLDNGAGFIAVDLQIWLRKVGVKPIQIYQDRYRRTATTDANGTLSNEVFNA